MDRPLLRTRLTIPPPPRRLVRRERLLDVLEREVPAHPLTLVSAPAGYGKTTLVAQWARVSRLPVAWLAADAGDRTVEIFLRYLFAAWSGIQPELERSPVGVLLGGATPDTDAVLEGLVNFSVDEDEQITIVIDEYDAITVAEITRAIAFLIEHLAPGVHLVLIGRGEPDLPLARYRARQLMLEIGSGDLRLTDDECRALVIEAMGLDLGPGEAERLNRRLEGWAAGLQLATLALRGGTALPDVAVTGRQRFIAEFLRHEVLATLPDDVRKFLLRTSIVDALCGSLCDAITGSGGGQAMLEALERRQLFTVPLDEGREWFRYHGLMLDVLRDELGRELPAERPTLHARAARWYLDRDMPEPAFDHALAADDMSLGHEVLDRWGMVKIFTGQFHTVQAWLQAVPERWYVQQPDLGLLRVALLLFTGQFERAFALLDDIEQLIAEAETPHERARARVTAVRCFIACESNDIDRAERFAATALETLPSADTTLRAGVWGALGDVYRRNGRWDESERYYRLALHHSDTFEGYLQSVHAYGALADLSLRRGRLRDAAGYWHHALAVIEDGKLWGAYPLPLIGWVHLRLGEILYEWNRLDDVRQHLEIGQEQARLGGDPRAMIAAGLLAARLHLATGHLDGASDSLERARSILNSAEFPEWKSAFDRSQVALWAARGELRAASGWADTVLRDAGDASVPGSEATWITVAWALLLGGDAESNRRASELLEGICEHAKADGRLGIEVEALALLAAARWAANDRAAALTAIERALRLGEPEGYTRTFVDLGPPVARVLREARDRNVMAGPVRELLAAAGDVGAVRGQELYPEMLSDREREVLRQLAAGLTNREIADALFISPETVKKHTSSIYGKLGARNRTEAVGLARDHSLLD